MPTLRIAASGSDFCDTYTTLKNTLSSTQLSDARYISAKQFLDRHRSDAATEFQYYKKCQVDATVSPDNGCVHLVFDFAEKVLLLHLLEQLGQLHFITGLKFDIFGVSCSNISRTFIFGLPEGHWPQEKTANSVISLLHLVLREMKKEGTPTSGYRRLELHVDNCAGQNKNRFVLWYLAWRVMVGLEDSINLNFLVAGHTKNVCDGSFGHVKRKFRTNNVYCPTEMMRLIEESSMSTSCIPSTHVSWWNWKVYLGQFFTVPTKLKVSEMHRFTFSNLYQGEVEARILSTCSNGTRFSLLKKKVGLALLRESWSRNELEKKFQLLWSPLIETPSSKDGTRKQYLTVIVLNRYCAHDYILRERYFSSGEDGTYMIGEEDGALVEELS